jgi:hypothetical protein
MRRWTTVGWIAAVAGCWGGESVTPEAAVAPAAPPILHEKTVISDAYHIDAIYRSMYGPSSAMYVHLLDTPEPELLWITGYESTVITADDESQVSQEYMCHANLDFDVPTFYDHFDGHVPLSGRLFTLSQGQQRVDFPPGFGIPTISTDPLTLSTQVLNLNDPSIDLNVRHRVTVRFARDSELTTPMKPLFQAAVQGFKSLEQSGLVYGVDDPDALDHGEGCEVGSSAVDGDMDVDAFGQKFTAHWVVEPGHEVTRTNVTEFLNLPFDTKAHYIAVHLHPFAESLELIDRTTGQTVFKSGVRAPDDRIGILEVDYFESIEGIPFFESHEYELVAVYNNTLTEPVDSMAVMYIYFHDPHFQRPDLARIAAARAATGATEGAVEPPVGGM